MFLLNPGYNRWATDPDGPYTLFVPLDAQADFQQALASLPPHDRVQWATHKVQKGDTIGGIAKKLPRHGGGACRNSTACTATCCI